MHYIANITSCFKIATTLFRLARTR